ncbi:hypothetical protein RSSM_05315 [Rhodopirellula sallentina SM41]|uniref:Uncharacterized protein n=1 Tax=Rhodopirellula sallentina SM41 TaxID=1263870 RepID=M5TVM3_9BACT|nr:hypothetical protein RSSM_05315 [Rhodopirellula sallentina SM41]
MPVCDSDVQNVKGKERPIVARQIGHVMSSHACGWDVSKTHDIDAKAA